MNCIGIDVGFTISGESVAKLTKPLKKTCMFWIIHNHFTPK